MSELEAAHGIGSDWRGSRWCRRSKQELPVGQGMYPTATRSARYSWNFGICGAHPVVLINHRNPPLRVLAITTNAHSPPLAHWIIQRPSIWGDIFFWSLRLVCKGVQLFNPAKFAGPSFDTIVDVSSFPVVVEVEADKCEVTTTKPDRTGLAGSRRTRTESAGLYDRIRDPQLPRPYRRTIGRGRRCVNEDEVMRCQMKCAIDLFTATR